MNISDLENSMVLGPQFEDEELTQIDEDDAYNADFNLREEERRERANEIADTLHDELLDMFGPDATENELFGRGSMLKRQAS